MKPSLDCDYVRDALPDLLYGRLSSAAAEAVRAHLRECAACRAEHELVALLHEQPLVVPVGLQERVQAAARSATVARPPVRRWLIAASLALVVGTAGLLNWLRTEQGTTPVARNDDVSLGVVGVEGALVSGTTTLRDLSVEELEYILGEMES